MSWICIRFHVLNLEETMNSRFCIMLIMLSLSLFTSCLGQEKTEDKSGFPVLKGEYLGQELPGKTPVLFFYQIFFP